MHKKNVSLFKSPISMFKYSLLVASLFLGAQLFAMDGQNDKPFDHFPLPSTQQTPVFKGSSSDAAYGSSRMASISNKKRKLASCEKE